jgi:hypothetical protein
MDKEPLFNFGSPSDGKGADLVYEIGEGCNINGTCGRWIKHKKCGKTSYNLSDVTNKYCGYCHEFLDEVK